MRSALHVFVLVVGFVVAPMSHAFNVYRVGSDAACTHSTIQAAINAADASPGEDYVAIASNQSYNGQHVSIDGQDVDIVGGFTDCSDADPEVALTTISGSGNGGRAVFTVRGTSHVYLSNLWVRNADRGSSTAGGGIDFDGAGGMELVQTTVSLNSAEVGGGISFHGEGGAADLRISHDTLVLSNTAALSGGGIIVSGTARLFMLEPQTYVAFNSAGYQGGGIAVFGPAMGDIGSPGYNGAAVVNFNDAESGGGIAADAGPQIAVVRIFSTSANAPVQISGNTARTAGGGIYLQPYVYSAFNIRSVARLCALDFRINDNIAPQGAGIYAADAVDGGNGVVGSTVLFNHTAQYNGECPFPEPVENLGAVLCAPGIACNELAGNVAENDANETSGAIVLLQSDSDMYGLRFRMHHNRGRELIRSITDGLGVPAAVNETDLSRCLITDNETTVSAIMQRPGGTIDSRLSVDECTFTRNTVETGSILDVEATQTIVTRSIFDQPGIAALSSDGLTHVTVVEVMSTDLSTFPPSTLNLEATPTFVDPDNGDYHLRRDSPGIDFASESPHFVDLDANPRIVDLPNPNTHGGQDLGALETQRDCGASDSIFCDGLDLN